MATLVSPGVSVSVIDESFYGSAGTGTVPLIILATGKDKAHPSGTGTASGTTSSLATLSLITSQRELLQTFGNPFFRKVGGTMIHGDNQNEYGLLAAHSYLGLANRVYVLRAGINLSELEASGTAPTGEAVNGTYWLDLTASNMGVFTYNLATATWVAGTVHKINSADDYDAGTGAPLNSIGLDGDFAWVAVAGGNAHNRVWQKVSGVWYHLGTNTWAAASSKDFQFAAHNAVPTTQSDGSTPLATGDVWIKTTQYNNGTDFKVKLYNSTANTWTTITSPVLASTDAAWANYGTPVTGNLFVKYNHEQGSHSLEVASHQLLRFNGSATLAVTGSTANPTLTGSHSIVVNGTTVTYTATSDTAVIRTAALINSAGITNIQASVSSNKLVITNTAGKDIVLAAGTGTMLADLGLTAGTSSNWESLSYEPNTVEPAGTPVDGTLWYDSRNTTVDLLETYDNSGSTEWRTFSGTFTASASAPTAPSAGDVWLDTVQVEAYPALYKYNGTTSVWDAIDNADQTTNQGIVFGNFRATSASSLEGSDIIPNPSTYPVGILGWNFMASGYDVKKYNATAAKWYNESGLQLDGSPYMGRHAQKKVITVSMAAAISASEDVRAETRFFNLISAPGFPELLDEMKTLNVDRKETAFIIGDSPMRLASDATSIKNWASNFNVAAENGEKGLVSSGFDMGIWYPGGCYTTNVTGDNVVQPPSHIVLRVMGYNDQVAFEWFAPAGYNRGLVNNATSVGYIDSEGEYNAVVLNQGQRDVLYVNKMNPIAQMPNRGLVVWGQKTLHTLTSALDRVNVSRLVAYLRRRFDDMSQPFLFEPNDEFTRGQVVAVFDQFLGDMVTKRALYDFLVLCDTSNNTPTRIDRNELWIDVAIQPVKAVEFIYIPVRVRNTGEDLTIAPTYT